MCTFQVVPGVPKDHPERTNKKPFATAITATIFQRTAKEAMVCPTIAPFYIKNNSSRSIN
jgi:hypothetical protein